MESLFRFASVESLPKDNRPIILPLLLMLLHTKDIWRDIHVFQCGSFEERRVQCTEMSESYVDSSVAICGNFELNLIRDNF